MPVAVTLTVTVRVKTVVSPTGREPGRQVTILPDEEQEREAASKVSPAGSQSVTVMAVEPDGPVFVTVSE
jgi:hypothetical protein